MDIQKINKQIREGNRAMVSEWREIQSRKWADEDYRLFPGMKPISDEEQVDENGKEISDKAFKALWESRYYLYTGVACGVTKVRTIAYWELDGII